MSLRTLGAFDVAPRASSEPERGARGSRGPWPGEQTGAAQWTGARWAAKRADRRTRSRPARV